MDLYLPTQLIELYKYKNMIIRIYEEECTISEISLFPHGIMFPLYIRLYLYVGNRKVQKYIERTFSRYLRLALAIIYF